MDSNDVKGMAQSCGMDMAGIVDPADIRLPEELRWCRSVIILGYPTLEPHLDLYMRMKTGGTVYASKWIYELIETRALRLCMTLRDRGLRAIATKEFDLIRAAVLAGFGVVGKNGLLLTERYGPRVRLIGVLTDAALEPDAPVEADFCTRCDICIAACPTGALDGERLDRSLCLAEFAPDDEMFKKQLRMERWLTDLVRHQCHACMHSCPEGSRLEPEPYHIRDDGE